MRFMIYLSALYVVMTVGSAAGQTGTVNPWREEAYSLPPFAHDVEVVVRSSVRAIAAYEPLILSVTLTNRDSVALRLEVRDDGLPDRIASVVKQPDRSVVRHDQWPVEHYETSPAHHEVVLAPGESTTGEVLIIHGGPPTGVAFPVGGTYTVQCACQPDGRFAPVMSNGVQVSVQPVQEEERSFFSDLRALSMDYYGLNEDYLIEIGGRDARNYEFGLKLLRVLLRHTKGVWIDPEDPAEKKRADLVKSFERLLERYPDSAYSGYLARYLGLAYLHWLRHEANQIGQTKWDSDTIRSRPTYVRALRYLSMAKDANVWPRTSALENLVLLYGLGQQWDQAADCLTALRQQCADVGGVEIADKLDAEMERFRARVEAHTANESPTP